LAVRARARVNRLTSIDEEKQGALDNVEARREREDGGVTPVKLERMVYL
jgi:hypothetical protein